MLPPHLLTPTVRLALYLGSGIGTAVVVYLAAKGLIGDAELALWGALVLVSDGVSAGHVRRADGPRPARRRRARGQHEREDT